MCGPPTRANDNLTETTPINQCTYLPVNLLGRRLLLARPSAGRLPAIGHLPPPKDVAGGERLLQVGRLELVDLPLDVLQLVLQPAPPASEKELSVVVG